MEMTWSILWPCISGIGLTRLCWLLYFSVKWSNVSNILWVVALSYISRHKPNKITSVTVFAWFWSLVSCVLAFYQLACVSFRLFEFYLYCIFSLFSFGCCQFGCKHQYSWSGLLWIKCNVKACYSCFDWLDKTCQLYREQMSEVFEKCVYMTYSAAYATEHFSLRHVFCDNKRIKLL